MEPEPTKSSDDVGGARLFEAREPAGTNSSELVPEPDSTPALDPATVNVIDVVPEPVVLSPVRPPKDQSRWPRKLAWRLAAIVEKTKDDAPAIDASPRIGAEVVNETAVSPLPLNWAILGPLVVIVSEDCPNEFANTDAPVAAKVTEDVAADLNSDLPTELGVKVSEDVPMAPAAVTP
jgi:hypothetical protein